MVRVSMNTRPRMSANRIPPAAPGLRAIASAAPETALPCPMPQSPPAMPNPSIPPRNLISPGAMPDPPGACANIGQATSRNSATRSSVFLLTIRVYSLSYEIAPRRWFRAVLGDQWLTLGAMMPSMKLVLVRCCHTHVNHREQRKNVGLQESDENVQTHENYGDHQLRQADEDVGDLLACEHVAVETNGER